jgi:type IV pilus assembly protein PilN
MVAFLISLWYQHELDFQRAKNAYLQSETQKLELQIKDVASLRAEIQSLKARQQAVENLQSDRNTPVQLLGQLVDRVPDGVYLQNVKQEGQGVTLTGVAQSQERVSELLRNISSSEDWLTRPELIEILSIIQQISSKEQRRVYSFTVRAQLVRAASKTDAMVKQ